MPLCHTPLQSFNFSPLPLGACDALLCKESFNPSILQSFRSALATLCFAKNSSILQPFNPSARRLRRFALQRILQSFNPLLNEESLEPTFRQSKASSALIKKAASYSPALHCSTIGAGGLNFSVRNGKRWNPAAITT